MVHEWEHAHSGDAEEQVLVVSLPRHDNTMLEIDHTAGLLEMRVNAHEVIHDQGESSHLLAQRDHNLIELHFMEHLLIERSDILP